VAHVFLAVHRIGVLLIGQAKGDSENRYAILPLLAIPAFLPFAVLIYWVVRVAFTEWHRRRADSFQARRWLVAHHDEQAHSEASPRFNKARTTA